MSEIQERLIAIGRAREIVDRLRANDWEIKPVDNVYQACEDAADEIERLMRKIEELEAKLEKQQTKPSDFRRLIPLWY